MGSASARAKRPMAGRLSMAQSSAFRRAGASSMSQPSESVAFRKLRGAGASAAPGKGAKRSAQATKPLSRGRISFKTGIVRFIAIQPRGGSLKTEWVTNDFGHVYQGKSLYRGQTKF